MVARKFRSLCIVVILFFAALFNVTGQLVSFELKTSPNINFDFNTIQKYINGITVYNACELNINVSGTQWDLYVGAITSNAGYWDVNTQHSSEGEDPPISILQLRFTNSSNTSLVPGFFPLRDINSPTYIIGTSSAPDAAVNCPAQGTNTEGDYLTSPGCYKFRVDMKLTPGLDPVYKAGNYQLTIDYVLVQDL